MQGTIMQNNVWVHPFISIIPINKSKYVIYNSIDNETDVYTYTIYLELDSFQKQNLVMELVGKSSCNEKGIAMFHPTVD